MRSLHAARQLSQGAQGQGTETGDHGYTKGTQVGLLDPWEYTNTNMLLTNAKDIRDWSLIMGRGGYKMRKSLV